MRTVLALFAALILSGCAFASWENGGTSIFYDGGGIWNDGGWLIRQSRRQAPDVPPSLPNPFYPIPKEQQYDA